MGAKRIGSGRRAFWPGVEEQLYREYQENRQKGLKVKHWWSRTWSKQLMEELHPWAEFMFSLGWFDRFKSWVSISLRRSTNVSQKQPSDLKIYIREFHLCIRRVATEGEHMGELRQFELAIRHHCHSLYLKGKGTTWGVRQLCGIVEKNQDWRSANAPLNSQYLLKGSPGWNRSWYFEARGWEFPRLKGCENTLLVPIFGNKSF
jgi:hypothetical protein